METENKNKSIRMLNFGTDNRDNILAMGKHFGDKHDLGYISEDAKVIHN